MSSSVQVCRSAGRSRASSAKGWGRGLGWFDNDSGARLKIHRSAAPASSCGRQAGFCKSMRPPVASSTAELAGRTGGGRFAFLRRRPQMRFFQLSREPGSPSTTHPRPNPEALSSLPCQAPWSPPGLPDEPWPAGMARALSIRASSLDLRQRCNLTDEVQRTLLHLSHAGPFCFGCVCPPRHSSLCSCRVESMHAANLPRDP